MQPAGDMKRSSAPQTREEVYEVGWEGRLEFEATIVDGMTECETARMQRLTRKRLASKRRAHLRVLPLPDERVAVQLRLQADLVTLAGHEPDLDKGRVLEPFEDAVLAHRVGPTRIGSIALALNESLAIPEESIPPCSLFGAWPPVNDGPIRTLRLQLSELLLQPAACPFVFAKHNQP
jgi:hypothetical protein